jgi:hypothetical protein
MAAINAFAVTTSGIVSTDETWSDTVTLTGDVICTSGTITIVPGTVVQFATTNDNVQYGTAARIFLVIMNNGALNAQGTPDSAVTFTTASSSPAPGAWGKIYIMNLVNSANTILRYCDIKYAQNGVCVNDLGGTAAAPAIDHCTISYTSSSGIYGGVNAAPAISNCTIHHTNNGIFTNGAGAVSITGTTIYHVPAGIILVGQASPTMSATVDHCTIHDVDMNYTGTPAWWTGYGIFFMNTASTAAITNTIVSTVSLYCMNATPSGWTVTEYYNCFYPNIGLGSIQGSVVDTTDLETDPLFTDAANADFSLDGASPCLGAASDSLNIGAWQDESIVPIVVSSFRAVLAHGNAQVFWVTQSEQDNLGWNVLRGMSLAGPFVPVNQGLISGYGTTAQPHNYSYSDNGVAGSCYYQLEQINIDGTRWYSPVIAATFNTAIGINVEFMQNQANVKIAGDLYDVFGRRVGPEKIRPGIFMQMSGDKKEVKKVLIIK